MSEARHRSRSGRARRRRRRRPGVRRGTNRRDAKVGTVRRRHGRGRPRWRHPAGDPLRLRRRSRTDGDGRGHDGTLRGRRPVPQGDDRPHLRRRRPGGTGCRGGPRTCLGGRGPRGVDPRGCRCLSRRLGGQGDDRGGHRRQPGVALRRVGGEPAVATGRRHRASPWRSSARLTTACGWSTGATTSNGRSSAPRKVRPAPRGTVA